MIERQWETGGHGMSFMFADLPTNRASNEVVAEFVRGKIRETVVDPLWAEKMCPRYPIGTYRLCLDTGYYETFNCDNVTLVDVKEHPIVEVTETGVRTTAGHYEVDLLIFAIGFRSFHGALDSAGIRNEKGQLPGDVWVRGPHTVLGLMIPGFPNLFTPTGAGSTSVLSRMFQINEFHAEWISDCIAYMERSGYKTIEASDAAAYEWDRTVASYAERLLSRQQDIYMVHVNADDGSRVFKVFTGGLHQYVPKARAMAAAGYEGFLVN
jgi:cation diffusion facilitator CzcD-associated flavoprotein CzcO